ncbi:multidrug-resistance type transporter aminotriazole resistance [Hypoxylon texense]
MAEAIATLSLVCNVMQIISSAGEVIELYRRTIKDGSPEPDLASNTAHLLSIASTLEQRTNEFDPVYSSTDDAPRDVELERQLARTRLKNLASDIVRDTKMLQLILSKIATTPSAGKLGRLKNVATYKVRYKAQISTLQQRIRDTRDIMNSEFLSRICSSTQAGSCRLEEGYTNLHESIKRFIDRWSEGCRALSELVSNEAQTTRAHVTTEAELTRDRITLIDTRLVSESSQRQLEETRGRLLSTLYFPEMNQRENNIGEASDDIVHETFGESVILDWLQSDGRVFWINGKVGSGKSTLVKRLINHHRTTEYLQIWNPSVKIFRFFFYEIGTSILQRTLLGCLRTLLHQLLDKIPNTLEYLLQVRPGIKEKISEHDWSSKELSDILFECLRHPTPAACLFIDGLDEIQTNERNDIAQFVESLAGLPNVKVCASCRPENIFRQFLGSYPILQVQDLNYNAILSHADKVLKRCTASLQVLEDDYQQLLSDLVHKSEGVFLWAVIAIESLARGIENEDSWTLLEQRLHEFAPNLNELYNQMWHKQNEDLVLYKRDAAKVFNYMLYAPSELCRWGHCLFATHQDLQKELYHLVASKGFYTPEEDTRIRQQYERWLSARTAGLIETYSSNAYLLDNYINFIHRSVPEFLKGTVDGQAIVGYDDRSSEEKYLTFFRVARDAAHIRATMFQNYKYGHAGDQSSIQMDYSIAMTFLILLKLMGVEGEKLVDRPEWMPPKHQTPSWSRVLEAAAYGGDVTVLYQIQHSEVFERISQQVKSQVLFACCNRSTNAWTLPERLAEVEVLVTVNDTDGLQHDKFWSVQILLEKLLRKTACVEWLLKHGANLDLYYEGSVVSEKKHTYVDPVQPCTNHRASAFHLFVSNAFWDFVLFSQLNLSSAGLVRRYAEAVQGCVKAMGERIRDSDDIVLIRRPQHHRHQVLFWLNITNTLNFIDRLASSPDPIDISTTLLRNPEIVHIHAMKIEDHWQRPSPTTNVENITKLNTLFLSLLLSDITNDEGIIYMSMIVAFLTFLRSGGIELLDHIATMSWEDVQGADAELYSNLPTV